MEFQVINRSRNAVIPEGMFKLCGMEDAKLISMVQLNGGILLMPESVSTYQLLMHRCVERASMRVSGGSRRRVRPGRGRTPGHDAGRGAPRVYACRAGLGARKGWDHGRHQTGLRGQ